jgi:hypothetical protein
LARNIGKQFTSVTLFLSGQQKMQEDEDSTSKKV